MSRSNSVSPPGVGAPVLRGGHEHRSAWAEVEALSNGCPYSARSNRKLTRTSSRWRREEEEAEEEEEEVVEEKKIAERQTGRTASVVARVSFRSKSAWQESGGRHERSSPRHEEVRPKSVELGLEERTRTKCREEEEEEEVALAPDVAFSFGACCRGAMHVFKSKKFQSEKLERLYQRYFFRLNQSSLTMLMAVLVLVCAVMLGFHCAAGPYHLSYVIVFSAAIALVFALMVACNRTGFHQDHMWVVCYVVIAAVLLVQAVGVVLVRPRSASEGVWWTVFFIYVVYTLLPVRMRAAVITGLTLAAIHVLVSWKLNEKDEKFLWKQVSFLRMTSLGHAFLKHLKWFSSYQVMYKGCHYVLHQLCC